MLQCFLEFHDCICDVRLYFPVCCNCILVVFVLAFSQNLSPFLWGVCFNDIFVRNVLGFSRLKWSFMLIKGFLYFFHCKVLKASALLQIEFLQHRCEQYLSRSLCITNCVARWRLAHTHNCLFLQHSVRRVLGWIRLSMFTLPAFILHYFYQNVMTL